MLLETLDDVGVSVQSYHHTAMTHHLAYDLRRNPGQEHQRSERVPKSVEVQFG